ncbi:helix-turn-helix domain-containing protein [Rhodococcus qingshengii]|uniref:IclR family transcriptional regulator n=1 Tax=Rhodococcus qingshengii TaxID=334542 RepID=UPI0024BA28D9|nr:helix-turn-helix domain-containing protein [Rhodococcus qingshengii]MDJ0487862.1 helix-turn-helix domain-containing protein [Rhodococcus qingshengii]
MLIGPITEEPIPMSTLDRLSVVVDCFRDAPRLTLGEVARRTGIPRSSVHRMLLKLVRMNWLRREGLEYEIGDKLGDLGALSLYRNKVDRVVTPLLQQLHFVTGHAVHLGVLEGNHVRYIQKIGSLMVPDLQTRVGSRIPAQASTIGKSLLSAGNRSVASSHNANDVRQHAVAFGICNSGMGCIGARIGVLDHMPVGLSICGPLIRGTIDKRNAAPVQMAAAAISQYFGMIDGFEQEKTG